MAFSDDRKNTENWLHKKKTLQDIENDPFSSACEVI
jgi:hypothetical protein